MVETDETLDFDLLFQGMNLLVKPIVESMIVVVGVFTRPVLAVGFFASAEVVYPRLHGLEYLFHRTARLHHFAEFTVFANDIHFQQRGRIRFVQLPEDQLKGVDHPVPIVLPILSLKQVSLTFIPHPASLGQFHPRSLQMGQQKVSAVDQVAQGCALECGGLVLPVVPVEEGVRKEEGVGGVALHPWELGEVVEVVDDSGEGEVGQVGNFATVTHQPHLPV